MKITWRRHAHCLTWRYLDIELVGPTESCDGRWHLIVCWGPVDPEWGVNRFMHAFPPIHWEDVGS